MWQCQGPPQQKGGVRSHGTYGSTGALLNGEVEPGATNTWQRVEVCHVPCLDLKLDTEVPGL
jgi:hypothetical protein